MPNPDVAAQNRHKVEKDRRRKSYHDSQVQGTNNSLIVLKRSVEMIYSARVDGLQTHWFEHFVPKGKRRSPAINRGYWIRMESIRQMVRRVLAQYDGQVRVVNLGCGFDPFPFQTLSEQPGKYIFYDFDYPELVRRKLGMITASDELVACVGDSILVDDNLRSLGVVLASNQYYLVGCDLKDTALYQRQMEALLGGGLPTIFIAEVSLAYMEPRHANPVVELSAQLPNSHTLVLEQIMPAGDDHFFAQKMLYHFAHLRSPLQCVETYSTREKQRSRFAQYYPDVEIADLFECWNQLVPRERKALVHAVEDFDEWEEFIVFCQHYVVIHARNGGQSILGTSSAVPEPLAAAAGVELRLLEGAAVQLKFPAACASASGTYMHGGLFQSRSDELRLLSSDAALSELGPGARMCHTLTDLQDGTLLLVGGRTRPCVLLDDIWTFTESDKTWHRVGEFPLGVARHSAVTFGPGQALVFAQGKFFFITVSQGKSTVTEAALSGTVPQLDSCGLTYVAATHTGYIVGGKLDDIDPLISSALFKFTVADKSIVVEEIAQSKHFGRMGCVSLLRNHTLYVVGGAADYLLDASNTVVAVDLSTLTCQSVPISSDVWHTAPVFLGCQVAGDDIAGGGAVCYSFGSSYNAGYTLQFT